MKPLIWDLGSRIEYCVHYKGRGRLKQRKSVQSAEKVEVSCIPIFSYRGAP